MIQNYFTPNSDAWIYLPAVVQDILEEKGYKAPYFTASVISLDCWRSAVFICNSGSFENNLYLGFHDLQQIQKAGVGVSISKGRLALHMELKPEYEVKEKV